MKSYKKVFLLMIAVNLLLAYTLNLKVKIEKESSFKIESSTDKNQKTGANRVRKGSDNDKIKSANFVNNDLSLEGNNNPEINNGKENGIINVKTQYQTITSLMTSLTTTKNLLIVSLKKQKNQIAIVMKAVLEN